MISEHQIKGPAYIECYPIEATVKKDVDRIHTLSFPFFDTTEDTAKIEYIWVFTGIHSIHVVYRDFIWPGR